MVARSGRQPVRPPGLYWSSERIFFCAVSLLSIESRLPADTPKNRRGLPSARNGSALRQSRLGDDADLEAAPFEEARDQDRPERRMIDVGVAGDDDDVELRPAARVEVGPGGGEERGEAIVRLPTSRAIEARHGFAGACRGWGAISGPPI